MPRLAEPGKAALEEAKKRAKSQVDTGLTDWQRGNSRKKRQTMTLEIPAY